MNIFAFIKQRILLHREINLLDKILHWLLLGIVFVLPIFILSPQNHPLEFNKAILFNGLVFIMATLFFLKSFLKKELKLSLTSLDWFVLAWIFFNIIAFIFSINHYVSLVGVSGFYSASLVSVISLIVFFYLVIQEVKSLAEVKHLIMVFLLSSALVIVFSLLQISGLYIFLWDIAHQAGFNLIANSTATLALFTAITLLLATGIFLTSKIRWEKIASLVLVVLSLILLFFLGQTLVYYLLAGVLFVFLLLATFKASQLKNAWVIWPTALLTLMILFTLFNGSAWIKTGISEGVSLGQQTSAIIAGQAFKAAPLWGSGQQTLTYDFSQYRPVSFNETSLWNLRFIKASNEWFGVLATLGLGGLFSLLCLALWLLVKNLRSIMKAPKVSEHWPWLMILTVAWLLIFAASFYLSFNFILYFSWWLLLALAYKIYSLEENREKIIQKDFSKAVGWQVATVLVFLFFFAGTVMIFFLGGKLWLAEYNYARGEQGINKKIDIQQVINRFEKARQHNPWEAKYYLSLAQGYATQALLKAGEKAVKAEDIQPLTQKVIDNIKQARIYDPKNVGVYEQEVAIYDSLRQIISNTDALSVEAYVKAIELEPNNPLLYLNIGRARLLQAQALSAASTTDESKKQVASLIELAKINFLKAKELKTNFSLADYNLGLAYQATGELDKALVSYQDVLKQLPNSVETHWQIALVLEQQKKIDEAIKEMEAAQRLSPDNQQIKAELEKLKNQPAETASP